MNSRQNYRQSYSKAIPAVIVFMFVLACPLIVFGQSYKMTGEISTINLNEQIIVVEVPLGSQMFTVAGPLAPDAKLTRDNQPAELKDFNVGEKVTVIFHSSDKGHVIDRLSG
jgi:hypothetical protein